MLGLIYKIIMSLYSSSYSKCSRCHMSFKPIGHTDTLCYTCNTEKLRRKCITCSTLFLPISPYNKKCPMCRQEDILMIPCNDCGNRFIPMKRNDRSCNNCSYLRKN